MASLIVQHKVRDYDAWRPAFDAHKSSQVGAGLTNGRVYRKTDDPNDIVILFDVADVAKARAWTGGEDLRTAMQNAGVLGRPSLHFVE
ncbi:MAG: cyclase [Methylobacteriaceae bacterium]|nr:cyclase [Methylobacteriaceae bacterium]MBV9636503.1 cyclase [Methylobacteriaceae bacterium]MBV9702974.1 cyclase [Methylobacteriaceae bacterium]